MEKYIKGFKFRIYPNKTQQQLINSILGCCRFIYNHFLDIRKNEWKANHNSLTYAKTSIPWGTWEFTLGESVQDTNSLEAVQRSMNQESPAFTHGECQRDNEKVYVEIIKYSDVTKNTEKELRDKYENL